MQKAITKSAYHAYNILHKGVLEKSYQEALQANSGSQTNNNSLKEYLLHHGFDPIIEKNEPMTKEKIRQLSQKIDSSQVAYWAITSGSSGEPLSLPYSKQKVLSRKATIKFFNEIAGYNLGDPFLLICSRQKPLISKFLRNEYIFIPDDLSEARIIETIDILKKKKIKVIIGYPSVMNELALYLIHHTSLKKSLHVQCLISTSEPLDEIKKTNLNNAFNAKLVNRYANEEVGLIAQQTEPGDSFSVNRYGIWVEVVHPETNKPVEEGEKGKVLVTDTHNKIIPIIRYDTGDLAIANKYSKGQLISLQSIYGRVSELIYSTKGKPLSSLSLGPPIRQALLKLKYPCQYQFAQVKHNKYTLRLKNDQKKLPEAITREMTENLKEVLGDDANISLQPNSDIKPKPSGKRPIYINELEKGELKQYDNLDHKT